MTRRIEADLTPVGLTRRIIGIFKFLTIDLYLYYRGTHTCSEAGFKNSSYPKRPTLLYPAAGVATLKVTLPRLLMC